MRNQQKAFTLVELLVVIGIIGLLLAIAMPAFNKVREAGKTAQLKTMLSAVDNGLEMFKNDHGSYPASRARYDVDGNPRSLNRFLNDVQQAKFNNASLDVSPHLLAEALFGADLLGYQKDHYYAIVDDNSSVVQPLGTPIDRFGNRAKRDTYVDPQNVNIDTFANHPNPELISSDTFVADNNNYVIMDNYRQDNPLPILYFKANTLGLTVDAIYDFSNGYIDTDYTNPILGNYNMFSDPAGEAVLKNFSHYILDQRTGNNPSDPRSRPYNKDRFLLITAGPDGEYGTSDDVCNFEINN